jgi:hypothetical protein
LPHHFITALLLDAQQVIESASSIPYCGLCLLPDTWGYCRRQIFKDTMFRKLQVVQHRRASDLLDARVGRDGRTGFSRRFGHRSASDLVVPIENQQRRAGVVGDALASSKRSGKSTGLFAPRSRSLETVVRTITDQPALAVPRGQRRERLSPAAPRVGTNDESVSRAAAARCHLPQLRGTSGSCLPSCRPRTGKLGCTRPPGLPTQRYAAWSRSRYSS